MAMNKYGRTTKMTSPPDKVVKNKDGTTTTTSGRISVTMSDWIQPDKTPTPKDMISEDDYNANEAKRQEVIARNEAKYKPYYDAVASYQKEQDDYKSNMGRYKEQLDIYKRGPSKPKSDPNDIKLEGNKNKKGQNINFIGSDSFSAEKFNADLDKSIKSGDVVDLYDKSIDPTTRRLILNSSTLSSRIDDDLYGKVSKVYIPKGTKFTNYNQIYGEDFNPEEFYKESKGKNFDKYIEEKGYKGRAFTARTGLMNYYDQPIEPKKPTSQMPVKPVIEEEKVPEKLKGEVLPNKMPTKKVLGISMKPNLKYSKDPSVTDEDSWVPPVPSKLNVEVDKSREGGTGGKWGLRKKIGGDSGDKNLSSSLRMSITGGGGRREEKMAKAFYSPSSDLGHGGYYSSMDDTEGSISKAIRSDIKNIRAEKKEWKNQTSLTGADKRAGSKEFRKDIQTGRLSARYAKRGDLHSAGTEQWEEGKNSRLKTWTADIDKKGNEGAMSGYVNAAEQNIQRIGDLRQAEVINRHNALMAGEKKHYTNQEQYIRKAEDNATNRNSTQARMALFPGWGKKIK